MPEQSFCCVSVMHPMNLPISVFVELDPHLAVSDLGHFSHPDITALVLGVKHPFTYLGPVQ